VTPPIAVNARLDSKTKMRVLCGRHPCRWEFGTLFFRDSKEDADNPDAADTPDEAYFAYQDYLLERDSVSSPDEVAEEVARVHQFSDQTCDDDTVANDRFIVGFDLGSGWVNRDDIWVLSTYALKRVRTGRQPKYHTARVPSFPTIDLPSGGPMDVMPTQMKVELYFFPTRAKCPKCGAVNVIDPANLPLRWPRSDSPPGSVHYVRPTIKK